MLCTVGHAIKTGEVESPIDFQSFLRKRLSTLFMREDIQFRKLLKPNENATLTLTVTDVQRKLRNKYYAVTVTVEGFMRGEVEGWLPINEE